MLGDIVLLVHIINGTETQDIVCHAPIRADLLLRQTPFSCAADCGGKGICGKCRIYVKGSVTPPDAVETKLNIYQLFSNDKAAFPISSRI